MKKFIALVLVALHAGLPIIAQEFMNVIAVQGNVDEFPATGYYASSNIFPQHSLIELYNPANNQRTRVLIVSEFGSPGNLMALSDDASRELGLSRDNPRTLTASSISVPGLVNVDNIQDLPYSLDPEVNPAASLGDPNKFLYTADPTLSRDDAREKTHVLPEPAPLPAREPAPEPVIVPAPKPVVVPVPEPTPEPVFVERVPVAPPAPPVHVQKEEPLPAIARGLDSVVNENPQRFRSGRFFLSDSAADPASTQKSTGFIDALERIREGSDPVSPEFGVVNGPHSYWPPEYDTSAAEEEEVVEEEPASIFNDALSEYATELDGNLVEEWIARARDQYPNTDLFLPSAEDSETPLSLPVPIEKEPSPLENAVTIEESADTEDVSDIGFDFNQDIPQASILSARSPYKDTPVGEKDLPIPESNLGDYIIQPSNIRTGPPAQRDPETGNLSLAQTREGAGDDLGEGAEGTVSQLSNIRTGPPTQRDPETGNLSLAQTRGVAGDDQSALQSSNIRTGPPSPSEIETNALSLAQYNAPSAAPEVGTEEEGIFPTIRAPEPGEVTITLEEAEFRSPDPTEVPETVKPVEAVEPVKPVETISPAPEPLEESTPPVQVEPAREKLIDSSSLIASLEENTKPEEEAMAEVRVVAPLKESEVKEERKSEAEIVAETLPLIENLQENSYYLQVGAFANPRSVKQVIEEISDGFPLAVHPVEQKDKLIYRVFVGPLNDDEKGTVLYWFKAKGFQDSFLRKGT